MATLDTSHLEGQIAELDRKVTLLLQPVPVWLNIEAAASYLSVSSAALRQRIKRDKTFPVHRGLGEKSPRFLRAELDAWISR